MYDRLTVHWSSSPVNSLYVPAALIPSQHFNLYTSHNKRMNAFKSYVYLISKALHTRWYVHANTICQLTTYHYMVSAASERLPRLLKVLWRGLAVQVRCHRKTGSTTSSFIKKIWQQVQSTSCIWAASTHRTDHTTTQDGIWTHYKKVLRWISIIVGPSTLENFALCLEISLELKLIYHLKN